MALVLPQQAIGAASLTDVSRSLFGTVTGTNGYQFDVYGYKGHLIVTAVQGGSTETYATSSYTTRGTSSRKRLVATFGDFGSVDLTFEQRGKTRHPHIPGVPAGCSFTHTIRPGVLRGTFSFQTRDAAASVQATALTAKSSETKLKCGDIIGPTGTGGGGHGTNRGEHAVFLDAGNMNGETGTAFSAIRVRDRREAYFSALVAERIGAVRIQSTFNTLGAASAFTYDKRKQVASVSPPAPFSGSAHFEHTDDGDRSWTGDLAIEFPGYGAVALTGPSFQANLSSGILLSAGGWFRPLP